MSSFPSSSVSSPNKPDSVLHSRRHSMPPYPSIHVPTEMWEHVIDAVSASSVRQFDEARCRTLASCCLVCRTWLPRARLHLFHSVILCLHLNHQNLRTFVNGIILSPANGLLVRWLMVKARNSESPASPAGSGLSLIALQLPQRLRNLHFLALSGVDLINIHPRTYIGLSRFQNVKALVVQTSVYSRHNQVYRIVKAFYGLSKVTVDLLTSTVPRTRESLGQNRCIKGIDVPSVTLRVPSQGIRQMTAFLAPCTVLDVSLQSSSASEIQAITKYLKHCGGALREVTLTFVSTSTHTGDAVWYNSSGFIDFSDNSRLLIIALFYAPSRQSWHTDMTAVGRTLSTIKSDQLEVLKLHFSYIDGDLQSVPLDGWEAVDQRLTSSAFRTLRKLHFGFSAPAALRDEEIAADSLTKLLPALAARPAADFSPFSPRRVRETY
ncbi:hypothetical protein BXZ70DRAFT_1040304 [Cristinia sonorae]|uniref:F-box domain-containing protein n=1 Tax=Cristinia sonorae TaxID=1940300 RepID=A0A8K0UJG3_9AGAR|nr:hypothetical protein BXZ70DRAFT_1040304 [Cristinia sonorae]